MDHLGKDQKVSLSKKTSKLFGKAFGSAVWSSTRPTLPLNTRVKCLVMASHDARGGDLQTNDVCKILGSIDPFVISTVIYVLRATPLHLCRRHVCIAPSAVNVWYQQVFETATMTRGTQAGIRQLQRDRRPFSHHLTIKKVSPIESMMPYGSLSSPSFFPFYRITTLSFLLSR